MKKTTLEVVIIIVLGMIFPAFGWSNRDIGTPSAPGSASFNEDIGVWTVTADGNDIWSHSDNFHYVYMPLMGDGRLTARVVNILGPGTNEWAKAGVMIREDLSAESRHAMMAMTPTAGQAVAFQWRPTRGDISYTIHSGSMVTPYWIRIERVGNIFTGYHSPDGVTWTFQSTMVIPMGQHTYIGLAVTSHEEGVLRTVEFDNVTFNGQIGMSRAFTYQGRLMDDSNPADGMYDFLFGLFDGAEGPGELGVQAIHNVDVIDGYFTVELDFGSSVFDGSERWLQIEVRPGELEDPSEYIPLNPRQQITAVPYALQTRGIFVDSAGNVGIGTKEPRARLSLGAEIPPTPKKLAIWDGIDDFYGFGADWGRMTVYANDEEKMTVTNTGNVGIGTIAPEQRLDVDGGNIVVQGTGSFDETGEEGTLYLGSVHHYIKGVHGYGVKLGTYGVGDVLSIKELSGHVGIGTTTPSYRLDVAGPANLNKGATGAALRVNGTEALWFDGTYFSWGYGGTANYFADNVGIGTSTPQEKLHVSGRARFDLGTGQINVSTPGGWPGFIAFSTNGHRRDITYDNSGMSITASPSGAAPAPEGGIRISEDGMVGIGTSTPTQKLDVAGIAQCQILKIIGGSDMAEPFDVKETDAAKAGMVLSIDPENPGKLKISQKAYDRCVAGIISGAGGVEPGMLMTQSGSVADGDYPVALTGRVYCLADASYGKIHPGDLLTTSNTPGHAMKVTDYNKAQGAVLGKAMTTLDQGQDLVLVLVTLQ